MTRELNFSELCGFSEKQWLATETADEHKYTLFGGSRGPGKSYWLRWYSVRRLLRWAIRGIRNVNVMLACEDYPSLKDRHISKIASEFPLWLGELKETQQKGLGFHLRPQYGGGSILLRNLDDPTKYMSAEFAGIGIDELTKNPASTFDVLRGSLRWPGVSDPYFIGATNPAAHWVRDYWIERNFPEQLRSEADQFAFVPALAHPIADPSRRIISQRFGENPQAYARFGLAGHAGIDFAVPMGTPVGAVDSGVVLESGTLPDYGEYIKIRHVWGESLYAHLSARKVEAGEPVNRGYLIGRSGNTGNSTGPHLHLAIRVFPYQRGYPWDGFSDPAKYLINTPVQPAQPQPADLLGLIKAAAQEFGIEWQLLASLAWAESSFDPAAVSGSGAMGLTQLMPPTWAEWSVKVGASDPFDPRDNLRVGAAYLAWLLKQTNGNTYKAAIAYVWGIGNVLSGRAVPNEAYDYSDKVVHGRDLLEAVGA